MKKLFFLVAALFAVVNVQARESVCVAIAVGTEQECYTWQNERLAVTFDVTPCPTGACVAVCVLDVHDSANVLYKGLLDVAFDTPHNLSGTHEGTDIEFIITTHKSDVTRCTMTSVMVPSALEVAQETMEEACTETCAV